ncbi:unnamed protein product [Hymenolepis diminuta]|uniref:Uncharacterized protein n=1 Tax=Hymenolepis diminuta TaxID=6216 RepID=A0A564Y061_HYMDI|nr:unnamed protein product [Hymenolepis diminuta]
MSSDDSNSVHNRLCQKIYHGGIEMAINLADEPSVALYRIQEHIRKTAPRIAEERVIRLDYPFFPYRRGLWYFRKSCKTQPLIWETVLMQLLHFLMSKPIWKIL